MYYKAAKIEMCGAGTKKEGYITEIEQKPRNTAKYMCERIRYKCNFKSVRKDGISNSSTGKIVNSYWRKNAETFLIRLTK